MKRLIKISAFLLLIMIIFTACTSSEKDVYKSVIGLFNIECVNSDFEKTESSSSGVNDRIAYQIKVSDKEREKHLKFYKECENSEYCKIPKGQNNFDILCSNLNEDFGSYTAVSRGYFALCNADGDLTPDLDSKSISPFDFDFYSAIIFDVDTNTLYLYKYSAS